MQNTVATTVFAAASAASTLSRTLHGAADTISDLGRNDLTAAVERVKSEAALFAERLEAARAEAAGALADLLGWSGAFQTSLEVPASSEPPLLGVPAANLPFPELAPADEARDCAGCSRAIQPGDFLCAACDEAGQAAPQMGAALAPEPAPANECPECGGVGSADPGSPSPSPCTYCGGTGSIGGPAPEPVITPSLVGQLTDPSAWTEEVRTGTVRVQTDGTLDIQAGPWRAATEVTVAANGLVEAEDQRVRDADELAARAAQQKAGAPPAKKATRARGRKK